MPYRTPVRPLSLLGNCFFQIHSQCHIHRTTVHQSPETELDLAVIWTCSFQHLASQTPCILAKFRTQQWKTHCETWVMSDCSLLPSLWRVPYTGCPVPPVWNPVYEHKCARFTMNSGRWSTESFLHVRGQGWSQKQVTPPLQPGIPEINPLGIIPLLSHFLSVSGAD